MFKHLDTYYENEGTFERTARKLFFSESLMLYIETEYNEGDKTETCLFFKPIDKLENISNFEADKIREQLKLNPADAITYLELFRARYYTMYSLQMLPLKEY